MTSPRILLAAGSIAATLAGVVPAISHGSSPANAATRPAAVSVRPEGVSVTAERLRAGVLVRTTAVVPQGIAHLVASTTGSSAFAARVRITVTRASDGATLFSGSLARFGSLAVTSGDALRVQVVRPAGFAGLNAATMLSWS